MAELEELNNSFDIITNCEHNVDVLVGMITELHKNISDLTAEENDLSIRAPDPPKTDVLNRVAWRYVIDVFKWCQYWCNNSVAFGTEYNLVDDMGTPVSSVAIWVPSTTLSMGDKNDTSFKDRVNDNWRLIGGVFRQLEKNFATMYGKE